MQGLTPGILKGNRESTIKLRELCGKYRTVPTSYRLVGVEKEGDRAQYISRTTEIWRGTYSGEVVALKILRVPRDDPHMPHIERTRSVSASLDPRRVACRRSNSQRSGFARRSC